MRFAPRCIRTCSPDASGLTAGTAKCMMTAGTRKITTAGMNRAKKVQNSTIPFCQTIIVVISPKGEKAPQALAPTTILMHERVTKRLLSPPTASTTAHIISAVLRLSAIGNMKNARVPVIQNRERKPKPLRTNQTRSASNTRRSFIALM